MDRGLTSKLQRLIAYDGTRRRLWIAGQRCHHGATGAMLALVGVARATQRRTLHGTIGLIAGSLLMAHDWKDRAHWFEPGRGSQE